MGFFDSIGKVLGAVSPILGVVGALSGQKKANNATDAYTQQINNNNAFVDKYWQPLWDSTQAMRTNMTNGPISDTYGLIGQAKALDPYGMNAANAATSGYQEFTNAEYNKGAANISNDLEDRGIDPNSSGAISAFSNLRSNEASNIAGYRRNAAIQNQQDAYNRVVQAQGVTNNLNEQNFGNSNNLLAMLASLRANGTAGLGGLQAMYQSKSDAMGNGLGQLANVFAQASAAGRGADAGNGRLGTNQAGSGTINVTDPWGAQTGGTAPLPTVKPQPLRFSYS